jgi:ABC-type bacteriocin/lantibiotic exporter with double-glycine peptidase domain
MSKMDESNIVIDLLKTYFKEEWVMTSTLVFLSLLVNTVQANGVSMVTAQLVESIERKNKSATNKAFAYLCCIFVAFILLYYIYKQLQTNLVLKLRQWIRHTALTLLLKSNKEEMDEINYANVSSPINRLAAVCFSLFTNLFSIILPSICFLLVVCAYLFWTSPALGIIFLVGNSILVALLALRWSDMFAKNREAITVEYENEDYLREVLYNFEKIIYRGTGDDESAAFKGRTDEALKKALVFQDSVQMYGVYVNSLVSVIFGGILWSVIGIFYAGGLSTTSFITTLTILNIYRDKMVDLAQIAPDCVEFTGRANSVLQHFKSINLEHVERDFDPHNLAFKEIRFENVSFRYKTANTYTFKRLNLTLNTEKGAIIGMQGLSGRGKSTIMKILLRMHPATEGKVYIDGVDIEKISPDYIRQNITYVSQNGKLFDRVVLDNMVYGCSKPELCSAELKQVLKYPKIRALFENMDLEGKRAGNLGENLSGGQRQVVNIISGLVNPSKILALDEPTNALDPALKREVMRLIQDYASKKNAVLIITHDKEMDPIFTKTVKI